MLLRYVHFVILGNLLSSSVGVQSSATHCWTRLSVGASFTTEWLVGVVSTIRSWGTNKISNLRSTISEVSPLFSSLVAFVCVSWMVYFSLRWHSRTGGNTLGTGIDSPIWESLGTKL